MKTQLIFLMAFYVFYIAALGGYNFFTRYQAIKAKNLGIGYFKTYLGDVSERVVVVGRHYDNQFQLPILFLVTCLVCLSINKNNSLTVILAAAFVLTRFGHSFEHLRRNKIQVRFLWFASGWLAIIGLWFQICYFAI